MPFSLLNLVSWFTPDGKKSNAELHSDPQMLRNALQLLQAIDRSNATIEFSMDGKILSANENFLNTLGYSLDEVVGRHHSMFVEKEFAASQQYAEFWRSLNAGKFQSERFKRIGKGNREVYIQATYNPVLDDNGTPQKVVKYALDVTEQVRIENEAIRLMTMVENLPTNLIFADSDFIIRYLNPASISALKAIENLLPIPVNKVIGSSIDIFHKNPEYQRRILADPTKFPIRAQIPLGNEILDLEVRDIRDRNNNRTGLMATWIVCTEQVAIRRQVGNLGQVGNTVAANVNDMAAAMREISGNVNRTAGLAKNAEEQSQSTNIYIHQLEESSSQIDEVVTLIRELADQTNLLALNATIEAARAGEAGRSFAVVASEVKSLATETRSATETIAQRVSGIRMSIGQVVTATGEISKSIVEVSQNSNSVAAAIEEQSTIISGMKSTSADLVHLSTELQKL